MRAPSSLFVLILPALGLFPCEMAAAEEGSAPPLTLTLRPAQGVPAGLITLTPAPGESPGHPVPANPTPALLQRYPMVVVVKDPSQFSMVYAAPAPGQYPIRVVPPVGVMPAPTFLNLRAAPALPAPPTP